MPLEVLRLAFEVQNGPTRPLFTHSLRTGAGDGGEVCP
jgi:hypothetical protein